MCGICQSLENGVVITKPDGGGVMHFHGTNDNWELDLFLYYILVDKYVCLLLVASL